MRTIVYTDGGCKPNPGPGGWAVVIPGTERDVELWGGEKDTTNNRMEFTAVIKALEHFPAGAQLKIYSDSEYVINCVTKWLPGWKKRGWRKADGSEVLNVEFIQRIDELRATRDVVFEWVKGHGNSVHNNRADELATLGRRELAEGKATPASKVLGDPVKPSPMKTASIEFDLALGLQVSQAAKKQGITPQQYIEEAVRLSIALGPDGCKAAREGVRAKDTAGASA